MNKERVISSFVTAFMIVGIWLVVMAMCTDAFGQHSHHDSSFDRFERIRILPPADIKFFDGKRIEYLITTGKQIRAGHFDIQPDTEYPKDLIKAHKGKYWFMYCETDLYLYGVVVKK